MKNRQNKDNDMSQQDTAPQKLSTEDAATIARLARLDLPRETLERFAGQFNDILNYMELLGQADTSGVKPLYSPVEHSTVFREDEVKQNVTREQILENAPESDGRFFIVPKIV